MVESQSNCPRRDLGLRPYAFRGGIYGALAVLILGFIAASAPAQDFLSNVELCNGKDRSSAEPQIRGCSELIKNNADNVIILSLAYNNRGNAYTTQGQYDLAIDDFTKSINLNPGFCEAAQQSRRRPQKTGRA
jgi:tetratricopeptide (TPR) repeat protein